MQYDVCLDTKHGCCLKYTQSGDENAEREFVYF